MLLPRLQSPYLLAVPLLLSGLACGVLTTPFAPVPPTPVPLPPQPGGVGSVPDTESPSIDHLPLQSALIPAGEMEQAIITAEVPPFDAADWQLRTGLVGPAAAGLRPARRYVEGDRESFFVDRETSGTLAVNASLLYVSEHAYFWAEDGFTPGKGDIERAAERFENEVYADVRRVFGSEPVPGIDGDPRMHILHAYDLGWDTLAFFMPSDRYPRSVVSDSNEREIIYVNLDTVDRLGDDLYMRTIAHEFEHLIQNNVDPNEFNWTDEGLAQVAERVAGFGDLTDERLDFLAHTDTPLTTWPVDEDTFPSYGANYLFYLYLWEQLGDETFARIVQSPRNGLQAVAYGLQEQDGARTPERLFADWTVANLVNDPGVGDGRFGYRMAQAGNVCPVQTVTANPFNQTNKIPQHTAAYYRLSGGGQVNLSFEGRPTAPLIPDRSHGGEVMWWASQGDNSNPRLTRKVDLTGVTQASLIFWTWFQLEEEYDTAYVSVSIDGGQKWTPLSGSHTSPASSDYDLPNYSGTSGGGPEPVWVQEQIDLTPYTGQVILLRFEALTDTYYTEHGIVVDDISIPEIGFADDVEALDPGWQAEGWLRTANVVPQHWGLYVVSQGARTEVTEIPVMPDGTARWSGETPAGTVSTTVVVAAAAPATYVPAQYALALSGTFAAMSASGPVGGALVSETFEQACGLFDAYADEGSSHGVEGGHLYIDVDDADWYDIAYTNQDFDDAVIEVETFVAHGTPDNSYGVVCRFLDYSNYYAFEIGNDGLYSIYAFKDDEVTPLVDFAHSDAIRTGDGASNHLRVACDGDHFSLTVNGELLADLSDSRLQGGAVGLSHTTYDQGAASVHFDNFTVLAP